ncbi:YadA-like family protein [Aggregatibacter sp. oral taxon 458]|uniref:YadA family autotransporter adhesin n=1 Tax=Aggregatibacter sp. oral taxon 458 TaxID=712148 RepID=UPI0025BBD3FF|nr:YadA-like family protein [Aggregatibacter sp. oral taxon 458]
MKKPLNTVRKLSTVSEFTSSKAILSAALVVGGLQFSPFVSAFPVLVGADNIEVGIYSKNEKINPLQELKIGAMDVGKTAAGEIKTTDGVISLGNKDMGLYRQLQNVGAGQISATSTDAVNGSQLYALANATKGIYDDVEGIKKRIYTFNIANNEKVLTTTSGKADEWKTTADDTLTLGATDELSVTTDGSGKIVYGFSETSKKTLKEAKDAATTVTNSLTAINASVKKAEDAAKAAKDSETAAKASETAAQTAETNAKASETAAQTAETNAKASETAAKSAETNAKASETAAQTAETNAKASETAAQTAETNAKASETSAKASETAAQTAETNAKASETAAKSAENNAKASETAAKTAEANAKASETAAQTAEANAKASETAAQTSETNAKASETIAKSAETNAKASEIAAQTAETNAKASETAAKTSEDNAKDSEIAAKSAETNAKASETAAQTAETNAKVSETAAKTAETNAKASETAAKTSETNAKDSETAAKASENMTQAFAQTAEKARDEAVLAQNKVTAEANGIKRIVQSSNEQGEINKEAATVDGRNSTAVGSSAQVQGDNSSAFGSQAKVVANKAVAVGQGTRVLAENSVALGQGSVVDRGEINTVSVGNATTKRRVTNVADGINAHDAVNVKQLNEVKSSVDSVRKDLQKNDKKLRGGIAGAAALANIPQVTQAGSNLLGVGVGNYRGESAVAVGYSKANESNKVIFKMSGSATTQGDFNVGAGIGYQW